jgi:hypothetical protein
MPPEARLYFLNFGQASPEGSGVVAEVVRGQDKDILSARFVRGENMLRRVLLALLCSGAISGVLSVSPVLARSPYPGSGFGVVADFFLRVALVPFVVSLALVIACDSRDSAGWIPFAVGPVLSLVISGGSLLRMNFLWQQLPIWLLSVCSSILGARLGAEVGDSRGLRTTPRTP